MCMKPIIVVYLRISKWECELHFRDVFTPDKFGRLSLPYAIDHYPQYVVTHTHAG